jgi:tetratricopeptide (TPR) repeat protein
MKDERKTRRPRAAGRGPVSKPDARPAAPTPASDRRAWAVALLPALAALVASAPALRNGFVGWDDDLNFLDNLDYRGLGGANLRWAWTTFHLGVYQPLSWMLLGAEYAIWDLKPSGYHLTSLVIFVAEAVALYCLVVRLLALCLDGTDPWAIRGGAALAVALYVAHPLRSEVVAWASCQPYLPCALFATTSVLAYLHAHPPGGPSRVGWGIAAFLLFAASLLSKAVAVGLPVVLVILDFYPLGRLGPGRVGLVSGPSATRAWAEKLPYFALSGVFIALAVHARDSTQVTLAGRSIEQGTVAERLAQACYAVCFYPAKTAWPFGLICSYPLPPRISWSDPQFLLSGLVVAGLSVALILARRRRPGWLAAWAAYLALLAPNSGLTRGSRQIAADRYSYVAMMALLVLAAAGLAQLVATRRRATGTVAAGLAVLAGLTALSWRQCATWHDSLALFRHAVDHPTAPDPLIDMNLGVALCAAGDPQASLEPFERAVRLDPNLFKAHLYLGDALDRLGRRAEAEAQFAEAVRLQPGDVEARRALGMALFMLRKADEAEPHLAEAVRLRPDDAEARRLLGMVLSVKGRQDEAEAQFAEALRLRPDHVEAHRGLGVVLSAQGKLDEAEAQFAEVLRLQPDHVDARLLLASLLSRRGRLAEAEAQFAEVLRRKPDDPTARGALAEIARLRNRPPSP